MITTSSDRMWMIAAEHVLALEDPDAGEEALLAALAWIEESDENYQLAQEVSRFSLICDQIPGGVATQSHVAPEVGRRKILPARPAFRAMAAAILLLLVPLSILLVQMNIFASRQTQGSYEYFTNVGESKSVLLPDRTKVVLGAASGIRVTYGDVYRRIVLTSGEAFFDVSKDKHRPLTVETPDGEVTALGTAFNVHRTLDATTVTLLRGIVKVETSLRGGGPSAYLHPNMQVEINRSGGLSSTRAVDGSKTLTWQGGSYQYEDTPLGTIVSDLQRYYRKPIILASADLKDRRFTGVVNLTNGDIEQWLAGLDYLGVLDVTFTEDAVIVRPRAPSRSKIIPS